jgi:uncharacterized protein YkwD
MRAMSGGSKRLTPRSLLLVAFLAALVALTAGPVANPAPANASTATTMESYLFKWVNDARAARGIPRLELRTRLINLAGDKAATMAATGVMKHPSCLSCVFRAYGVSFSRCGEALAYTTWPWGYQAAKSIFYGWKGSTDHWSLLMSRGFNRVGYGVAYRSSSHATFAAAELAG